ncbi:MAG: DUF6491 family protein [Qipengyuania sp.]
MTRPLDIRTFALVPAAALACVSCVQAEGEVVPEETVAYSADRACFFTRQIDGYGSAPDGPHGAERLYVRTSARERFLLETYGPCPGIDWSLQIGLDTRFQSSLCTGDTATLVIPRSIDGGTERCTARVLGRALEP